MQSMPTGSGACTSWARTPPCRTRTCSPPATKDGTVTNTNRQVQIGRKALPLPGQARQDLEIIIALAQRLGLPWSYGHVSEVFDEMTKAMPSLANITWERLEREDSVTYP